MRILKKFISLALCTVIPFALASCSDEGGEEKVALTTQASSIESTTKSKEDLLARVIEANLLENLLKRNESVSFKTEYDGESTTEIYFSVDSEIVRVVDQNLYYADEFTVAVEYKGMNGLSVNGERFRVRAFFDVFGTEENEDKPWYNDTIAYPLINDNLSLREETDEYYIFENLGDDPDNELYIQTVCYVDKQTLNIVKTVHDNDGYVVEEEYIYNEPNELMNVLDDWKGEMKNVTVVYETYKDGNPVTYTEEYEVPYGWEVIADNNLYDTPEFSVYLDEGYTQEYEYPGDGIDYTIYVTTAMG